MTEKITCAECGNCSFDRANPARLGFCDLKTGHNKLVHVRTKKTCKDFVKRE